MRLCIVRHGIAVPHGTPGVREDDRFLTEEGREKMQQAAMGLRRLGFASEVIWTSPLIRARQTAEILQKAFGKGIAVETHETLAPSGSRQGLYREIRLCQKRFGSLTLVGHQPSLGEIAGEIAWGSPECSLELKKGGACVIDLQSVQDVPRGVLIAFLPPSVLRACSEA